ncbi:MAG: tandem-95 repeat protein [Pyrinomonadaceae bacterium MAG19_C2-C3]|nr:tandem-95 repeat protein [Pyrinomonadaceae bacterium MAG19_C2-C3]
MNMKLQLLIIVVVLVFGASGAFEARAQSPADVAIMENLRDNHGFGQAFGWPTTTNPCLEDAPNWPGVSCSDGRVAIIAVGCVNTTLTTPFPGTEIASLTALISLELRGCYFNPHPAGNFAALDTMTQLTKLRIDNNFGITGNLSDVFPQGLGPTRFPALAVFHAEQTSLGGQIPAGVMEFNNTRLMRLYQARFSGTLPVTGNPSKNLLINGNALEGVLPDYIRNASGLVRLGYNKFDVVNTPPGTIDTVDAGWRTTQTVPPTNVQIAQTGAGTATVSWTPIAYTAHGGYYEVLSSTAPGGPYVSRGTTAASGAKTATGLTVSGLPGGTNYFVVRTFTPAHTGETIFCANNAPSNTICTQAGDNNSIAPNNPNDLTSVNSAEVNGVINTPPTITAATGLMRQQSTAASNSTIATVGDAESGAGGVTVTVTSANPSNGVTVSNIVNTGGTLTADIFADCTATDASFTLEASDGTDTATATLNIGVTANTPPTLTYDNPAAITTGGSTTVNPATVSDNGTIQTVAVQSQGTYTGTISVDGAGMVSIGNAAPVGTHTITIRATDDCGDFTDASFMLTVNPPPPISGTKTVGAGGDYDSLTGANGLFAAINASTVTGNITANITGDLTEDGTHGLNQFLESGAGNYTLTIQPADGTMKLISGNVANGMIRLNGADRVTIDGRFDNGATANGLNGADGVSVNGFNNAGRFLTFRNTDTQNPTFTFINDASDNTVRSSIIEGATTSNGVVFFSVGTTTGNDNNTITDNQIRDRSDAAGVPSNLVLSQAASAPSGVFNSGNTISNNELFNFANIGIVISQTPLGNNESWTISGNNIYQTAARTDFLRGILFNNSEGTNTITQNTIRNLDSSNGVIGIQLDRVVNAIVERNRIHSFPADNFLLVGISYSGSSNHSATLVNNQITLIPSVAGNAEIFGIRESGSGSNRTFNAYYNSVLIGGTASGVSKTWACLRGAGATSAHTSRNNICFNNRTGGTGSHFAAGNQSSDGSFSSNYNLFVGTGATAAADFMDFGTSSNGTPVSFAAWQTSTGGDANSNAGNASGNFTTAMFVDPTIGDLHIVAAGNPLVSNTGTPVAGITTDFDDQTRNATTPDIGSDEYEVANTAPTASDDSYSVNEDLTLNVAAPGVITNDMDGENDSLTAMLVMSPANAASFTFNPDGSFDYTPSANFNGMDSFTYKVSDGTEDSNTATVQITVNAVNDDPDAVDDSASVASESVPKAINVLANDSDIEGDTLTITAVTQGANGSVAITGGGTGLTYMPNLDFVGTDSFTYTISDGNGGMDTASVAMTVTAVTANLRSLAFSISIPSCLTATGTLTLTAPAPAGGGFVTLTNSHPAASVPTSVFFPAGTTRQTFSITTRMVDSIEQRIVTATRGSTTLSRALRVTPIAAQSLVLTPNSVKGGNSVTATVTLKCAASLGGVTVALSSNNAAIAQPALSSITIAEGDTVGTFTINTSGVTRSQSVTIRTMIGGSAIKSASLSITP